MSVELTLGFWILMFMIFYSLDYLLQLMLWFYLLRLERDEFSEVRLLFSSIALLGLTPA